MNNLCQPISIGIDVAKEKFDAAFLYEGSRSSVETFENDKSGIRKFIRRLQKQKTAEAVPCVLESTGLYHLNAALMARQAGYRVSVINPLITKKYQRSSIRNAKTDTIDAVRLAEIGINESKLPRFSADIASIEAKKLVSYLGKLEQFKQQLTASLNQVKLVQTITGLEVDLNHTQKALVQLKKQMKVLEERIKTLAPAEAKILADNTYGLSHEKMAAILAVLGDKEFENRDQLVAFAGLDVMPRESGTWRGKGRLSKRGSPYLRKLLYQVAWGLKQNNPTYKAHYEKLRADGKNYTATLIILARKFLRFLYAYYWKKSCPQFSI